MSLFFKAVGHQEIPENTASHPAHNVYTTVTAFRIHFSDIKQPAFIDLLIDQIIGHGIIWTIRNTYEQVYNMLNSLTAIKNISCHFFSCCFLSMNSANSAVLMNSGLFNLKIINSVADKVLKNEDVLLRL